MTGSSDRGRPAATDPRPRKARTRRLLPLVAAGVALVLGLGALAWTSRSSPSSDIEGRVVSPTGRPVDGATVRTPDGRRTVTDARGRFVLAGAPAWATVTADGWISRTRVLAGGSDNLVRLAPRHADTVTFAFGGDVMFGRRFFDPEEDGSRQGQLDPGSGAAAHERLLAGVAPVLADADLTAVNLETPLVDDPSYDPTRRRPSSFHATKEYAFASAPAAAVALKRVGVDVVDIGNNHLYDRLQAGVAETQRHLADAGLARGHGSFGAGVDADQAWRPALQTVRGQQVAFLGCTTITGDDQPISYVATASKGGAARCAPDRLSRAVRAAHAQADIVVVMIHGGYEYGRTPSAQVRALSDVATAAGATLVINHHPHVVGGLRLADGRLTAWTMGNLVFDQTVWPTFESYVLKVAVEQRRVVSAWLEPVQIQDFRPVGIYGDLADWVSRGALARSEGPWVAEAGSLWLDRTGEARTTAFRTTAGPLQRLTSGCVPGAGRELLWSGDFEASTLSRAFDSAPLWNVTSGDAYRRLDPDAAATGRRGVLLTRSDPNTDDVLLNPLHRVLVDPGDSLTLLVDHRDLFGDPDGRVQLSWYNDTQGPSQRRTTLRLPRSDDWTTARIDVTVPRRGVAVQPFLRLAPPSDGVSQLGLDNVRLVDWDQPGCDYVRRGGDGTRTMLPPVGGDTASVAVRVSASTLPAPRVAPLPRLGPEERTPGLD